LFSALCVCNIFLDRTCLGPLLNDEASWSKHDYARMEFVHLVCHEKGSFEHTAALQ